MLFYSIQNERKIFESRNLKACPDSFPTAALLTGQRSEFGSAQSPSALQFCPERSPRPVSVAAAAAPGLRGRVLRREPRSGKAARALQCQLGFPFPKIVFIDKSVSIKQ